MHLRQANPRRQGDIGELAAMEWLTRAGYDVYLPLGHSPDIDMIAALDGELLRVQVKTSTALHRPGVYGVTVCTRGGNRSWNGLVKRLDPALIDYLFVLVADGRRWFIPAGKLEGRSGITLGTSKYAAYEIEPWSLDPGRARAFDARLEGLGSADGKLGRARGDVRVVKGGGL
jgi:hypothetical protein